MTPHRIGGKALVSLGLLAMCAAGAGAQQSGTDRILPTNQVVLTGYGTVGYRVRTEGSNANSFTAGLSPVLLFQFQDRVLFEAELEFELQEGITETGLEYAQLSYIATNTLVISGGKFLLPFGVFGERLHPTWINRFPTAPPIYGHHVSSFGAPPLVSVLSDVGAMAKATFELGDTNLSFNGYMVQGPAPEDHADEEEPPGMHMEEVPEVHFPASSADNNGNKLVGGRIDLGFFPWAEVNLSAFTSRYDDNNDLSYNGYNIASEVHYRSLEVRGEYLRTLEQAETDEGTLTLARHGYYAQGSYRYGAWEPVLRWTQVFDDKLGDENLGGGARQAGLGLDYWLNPSISVMCGYEINRESGMSIPNDRFVMHVAFGF